MSKTYDTNTVAQRERLLEWLRKKPITTLQARKHLDILGVAPRIYELRHWKNLNIVTHWIEEFTPKGRHLVAKYVLQTGKFKEEKESVHA